MKGPAILLVPTDFSASAARALEHAIALATRFGGSTIYLLHAYELPLVGFPDGTLVPTAAIATQIVVEAEQQLAACVAIHAASGVPIVPLLRQADPRAAVLAAIDELSADLVVMGTHGRRGIARVLVGSVAESVVRASTVPVMTVHAAQA
jgi:nucleotide-binding universal stress UspA family protein